jgi:ABC-type antimicrobial peptide transport system permease subunit
MFHLSYIAKELRRRLGRTLLTALGLALGVGLVIGIVGVSQGLSDAQDRVLAPLGSVGTDILVTRVAGVQTSTSSSSTTTSTTAGFGFGGGRGGGGGGGGGFFGGGGGAQADALNQADTAALLNENSNVITDLAKLGKPGDQFTHDFFLSATLLSFPQSAVDKIKSTPGVSSAVGGLVQQVQHQTGTVPNIVASVSTASQTVTQTVRPAPQTDAERAATRTCLEGKGFTFGRRSTTSTTVAGGGASATTSTTTGRGGGDGGPPGDGGGPGGGFAANPDISSCLPARFQQYEANVVIPARTIQQVVNPPSTDIKTASYIAAGVDPAHPKVGLVTVDQLTSGTWLPAGATTDVLVSVAYANSKSIKLGDTIPINGTDYRVLGLVNPTLTGSTADIYFPLATLQKLATKTDRVTQVLVKANSAANVDKIAAAIKAQLPGAEVVTTKALANQVTGSLADARKLANRLGGALAVIVLLSAFAIAVLLTLSSIAKRVREIGTLRAIGWSKGRVVRQLLGETLGIGLIGGVLGLGVGALAAAAVHAFSPSLSASTTGVPGVGSSSLSGLFGQATTAVHTTKVTLSAPLHPSTLLLGLACALVGGLLAGLAGGWRAARLAPAVALRDLG